MKIVATQIGTSSEADFEENTWTFLMNKGYKVWPGQFAIVDKLVYEKLVSACERSLEVFKQLADAGQYPFPIMAENEGEGFKFLSDVLSMLRSEPEVKVSDTRDDEQRRES